MSEVCHGKQEVVKCNDDESCILCKMADCQFFGNDNHTLLWSGMVLNGLRWLGMVRDG